ncbi:MAG: 1-phosphofructokinase [Candidatus Sumerlaeota bacterium]|nr:1-phosphofructokinase [Candidatus Sumerlaeota bacterium]
MIATVTLNPALDLFLGTEQLAFDAVLRASHERRAAGGKGINVTRVLGQLGCASRAYVLGGGGIAQELKNLAEADGIDVELIDSGHGVRINVHIEEQNGRHLKVNMAGEAVGAAAVGAVIAALEKQEDVSTLVLAGSLPPGVGLHAYSRLITWAKERGVDAALDTSGPALAAGAAVKPAILKVNRREFADLVDCGADEEALAAAMCGVREDGIGIVCVTHSENGALLADATGVWSARAPERSSRRAVGAGDSFLAGLLDARRSGKTGAALLAWAIATGTAWALAEGRGIKRATVEDLAGRCAVSQLS